MTTLQWFKEHGYERDAQEAEDVIDRLKAIGSKERRNWWDVFAGGKDGKPLTVAGHTFRVLAVAQMRQGKPVTSNAVPRSPGEPDPPGFRPGRWAARKKKRSPAKANKPTRRPSVKGHRAAAG